MFAEVNCPETLSPQELDRYLDQGWFRMGQTIFTTNFLNFKNQLYSAIWLRIKLDGFSSDGTFQKLAKRNEGFKIVFQKVSITEVKEVLYLSYKQNLSFEASASLNALLFGKLSHNLFNTQEVNIFDGDKLIASGFFDLGEKSAAGIISFYDPVYKKYSLGKYLIYLKIEFCRKLGFQYFYPGYFVPGYSLFDYKLEIGKPQIEYLELTSKHWRPIGNFSAKLNPLQQMYVKLGALQTALTESRIESHFLKYDFFDVNLIPELKGIELFDFPVFLLVEALCKENINTFVFDVIDQKYHWIQCTSVWPSSTRPAQCQGYSSHVLKFEQELFSTVEPAALAEKIQKKLLPEATTKSKY